MKSPYRYLFFNGRILNRRFHTNTCIHIYITLLCNKSILAFTRVIQILYHFYITCFRPPELTPLLYTYITLMYCFGQITTHPPSHCRDIIWSLNDPFHYRWWNMHPPFFRAWYIQYVWICCVIVKEISVNFYLIYESTFLSLSGVFMSMYESMILLL